MEMQIEFAGGKKINSVYNGFTIQTDQPVKEGGDGTAPSPYEYFLSSLGTCAGIFVLSFCQNRNIPIKGMKMTLNFDWNNKTHLASQIRMNIHLPSEFPEKYRSAVIKAAEQCAVKRSLFNPPEFLITAN